jgi:hypothetical protein
MHNQKRPLCQEDNSAPDNQQGFSTVFTDKNKKTSLLIMVLYRTNNLLSSTADPPEFVIY